MYTEILQIEHTTIYSNYSKLSSIHVYILYKLIHVFKTIGLVQEFENLSIHTKRHKIYLK